MTVKQVRNKRRKVTKKIAADVYGTGLRGLINRQKTPVRLLPLCVGTLLMIFSKLFLPTDIAWFFGGMALVLFALLSGYIGSAPAFIASFTVFASFPLVEIALNALHGTLTQSETEFFTDYILLFAFLPLILVVLLIVRGQKRGLPSFSAFRDENGKIMLLDPALELLCPIEGFKNVYVFEINIPADLRYASLIAGFLKFSRICDKFGAIPAGAVYFEKGDEATQASFFVYTCEQTDMKEISAYLAQSYPDYTEQPSNDPSWEIYKSKIVPDDLTVQREYNRRLAEKLERRGMDLSETKKLDYIVAFKTEDEAKNCVASASENGFTPVKTDGDYVYCDTLEGDNSFIVTLQLESKLGLARLNINSQNVIDFVKKFNGSLRQWIFSKTGEKTL